MDKTGILNGIFKEYSLVFTCGNGKILANGGLELGKASTSGIIHCQVSLAEGILVGR